MAKFKTPHFQIVAASIKRSCDRVTRITNNSRIVPQQRETTIKIAQLAINAFVDDLCTEFARDNRLFNETLFRAQCGDAVSKINITDRSAS